MLSSFEKQNRLPVIDFHSHILPKMDDGSKSTEMSLQMLNQISQSGVDTVVATPHYYGFRENISDFLQRRNLSWKRLSASPDDTHPKILLGAEVAFFSGLTTLDEELDKLCIENSRILLLEMPFAQWSGMELDAVSTLCLDRKYKVILAHFERFLPLQRDMQAAESLLELPIWIQVNAERFLSFRERKSVLKLFETKKAHLLGSDCHNLDRRPPNLGQARKVLAKKLGQSVLDEIDRCGNKLLEPDGE